VDLVAKLASGIGIEADVKRLRLSLGRQHTSLGRILEVMIDLPVKEIVMNVGIGQRSPGSMGVISTPPTPQLETSQGVQRAVLQAFLSRHLQMNEDSVARDIASPTSEQWVCEVGGVHDATRKHLSPGKTSSHKVMATESMMADGQLFQQRTIEQLYESRVASANRLISFYVFFHAMVEPVARLPLINFPIDRTPSRLRVASTPAPIPINARIEMKRAAEVSTSKVSSNVHKDKGYLRSRRKVDKAVHKARTITAGDQVVGDLPPMYESPRPHDDMVPFLEPVSLVLPEFGSDVSSGSGSGDFSGNELLEDELLIGGSTVITMAHFDAEISKAFARYDFMDAGVISHDEDVRMIAVNVSFKLGLRISPEELVLPEPDKSGSAYTQEAIKVWFMKQFDIKPRHSLPRAKSYDNTAGVETEMSPLVAASSHAAAAVPPMALDDATASASQMFKNKGEMKSRVAQRLKAKRAALTRKKSGE